MSENRRFYWLKLMTNFFDGDDVKIVERQQNGAEYIIFWLKLLLRSVTSAEIGVLRYRENIPYTPDILATITNTNVDIVKGALALFTRLGMIQISEQGDIFIDSVIPLIGCETTVAERMRRHRRKQKQIEKPKNRYNSLPHKEITASHCYTELEKSKRRVREEKNKNSQNSEIPEFSVLGNDSLSLLQKREQRIKILDEQAKQLRQEAQA